MNIDKKSTVLKATSLLDKQTYADESTDIYTARGLLVASDNYTKVTNSCRRERPHDASCLSVVSLNTTIH